MENNTIPCPIEGVVVNEPAQTSWLWGTSHKAVCGPPKKTYLIVYEQKDVSQSKTPYSSHVGASATLETIYQLVGNHFGISQDFAICSRSSTEPISLIQLHGGQDLVAYVDAAKPNSIKAAATEEGAAKETIPIPPGPVPEYFARNFNELLPTVFSGHLRLLKNYGPVFKFSLPPNTDAVIISDPELAGQVIGNQKVWQKLHFKHNQVIRGWVNQGLFTADDDEEIWGIAHRILLPAFSNLGMRLYFHMVQECISTLFDQWDALVEKNQLIELTQWTERFTFDVIGRVGFGYDFKAVQNGTHPYLTQIQLSGELSDARRSQSYLQGMLGYKSFLKKWLEYNEPNVAFVDKIVAERQAELDQGIRVDAKDVLTLMLVQKDPQTGQKLPAENIRDQILTFLLAGHDSTSTAITVLFMLVSQHGDVERKVVEEVERVIGDGPVTFEKLGKLDYCTQVINESLRMFPPATANRKDCVEDTTLGPYHVPKGTAAITSLWGLAHNPDIWPDPWKFDPDRWSPEKVKARSPFASIPFSAGHRGCLGRQLSIMEQRSILVYSVQRYHLRLSSRSKPSLSIPLFIKPHDVFLSLQRKDLTSEAFSPDGSGAAVTNQSSGGAAATPAVTGPIAAAAAGGWNALNPISIPACMHVIFLYGSNMGTSESFAGDLAQHVKKLGIGSDLMSLDDFLDKKEVVKKASAVIIISSSYNGLPPDNAVNFMKLLATPVEAEKVFSGVNYAVFGCGNTQWTRTYQAVPTAIDSGLEAAKANRMVSFTCGDADSSMDEDFQTWKGVLWDGMCKVMGITTIGVLRPPPGNAGFTSAYSMVPSTGEDPSKNFAGLASEWCLKNGLIKANVLENYELQAQGSDRSTRHIEIELCPGMTYTAGNHLAVLGGNATEVVAQAAKVVGTDVEEVIKLTKENAELAASSIVPCGVSVYVKTILTWCVELQQQISKAQLSILIDRASCPPEKKALQSYLNNYESEVLHNKRTLIELLDTHKSATLNLSELLTLLPPLKPRYYSISSSSKIAADRVSVTVGVVKGVSPTGRVHYGVASNFLAARSQGDIVRCFVKDTKSNFRLPADGTKPIILVGPGTGYAPMRGFLQDRDASKATGPAYLFFGCRNETDHIYKGEMERFKGRGVLQDLQIAYSRKGKEKVYVQHLIEKKSVEIYKFLEDGAYIYVCGDAKHMAPDVRDAFAKVYARGKGVSAEQGKAFIESMVAQKKYAEDVWACCS